MVNGWPCEVHPLRSQGFSVTDFNVCDVSELFSEYPHAHAAREAKVFVGKPLQNVDDESMVQSVPVDHRLQRRRYAVLQAGERHRMS